ncbi:LuxR C-terminal-related transcriptional regulator [Nonomuraea sp. NPDC050328]|uniref:LuxR C-terminal-related transcriptional regulator n=1 Tax=Nonomuraea sp. NPDC050328 TaxID=3364361 RepID=UPI0037B58E37
MIVDSEPVLGALGVADFDERAYRLLLRRPGASIAALAAELGAGETRLRRALTRLSALGLVRRGRPGAYEPVAPEAALGWLVDRRRLEHEANLAGVRTAVTDFAQLFHSARLGTDPSGMVEVLTGESALQRQAVELDRTVTSELLLFDRPPYVEHPHNTNDGEYTSTLRVLERGVRVRVIYCPASVERPGRFETLTKLAEAGEQSRMAPSLPFKLRVADRRLAVMPLVGGVLDNIAVIRPSGLLDALIEVFEAYWDRAQPLTGPAADPGDRPSEEERLLLQMLHAGLKDEAIARQLGVSGRTATRRIAALVERLGATTRFQAGVEAAARGWLR